MTTPFVFTGQITTTGPAEVTYRWAHDDGTMTPVATLTFSGPSTQTVTHTWDTVGCATTERNRWARLVIVSPND